MKRYHSEKIIQTDATTAWQALSEMNLWLPDLSTVKHIKYDASKPFFQTGTSYRVITPEGIAIKSLITAIDEKAMSVSIRAHVSLLSSHLTCCVKPSDAASCTISREQAYGGIVGALFTRIYNTRESNETTEYLDAWEAYAMTLHGNHAQPDKS